MNNLTFHITLGELFIFAEIIIAFTFACLLWFTRNVNRSANRCLAGAIICMASCLVQAHWNGFAFIMLPAAGPLTWMYVRKLITPSYTFTRKSLIHFTPLLLQSVVPIPAFYLLSFISFITYLFLAGKLINNYYRHLEPVAMDRPKLGFRWLRKAILANGCIWTAWMLYGVVNFVYGSGLAIDFYYPLYLCLGIIIIVTAAAAYLRPRFEPKTTPSSTKPPSIPLQLIQKANWLKSQVEESKYYEDPELDLKSLSEKLGLHTHELSRLINTAFKKSFNDFISEYRVLEVIRKMQDPTSANITLQGLAFDAGFNSKSSFNRIFKQVTGKTPLEFKVSLENERPPYKLRRLSLRGSINLKRESTGKWAPLKVSHKFMFRSYLKIAWRNLLGARAHSALNIAGLAVGMTVTMLIGIWIWSELSFNQNFKNYDRIVRVVQNQTFNGEVQTWDNVPMPLSAALRNNYGSDFKYVVTAASTAKRMLTFGDTKINVSGNYMDPEVAEMLSLKMLKGNRAGLSGLNSILLSASAVKSFFGDAEPLGKVLLLENKDNVTVTGVYEDIGENSDFSDLHFIAPFQLMVKSQGLETILKNPWGASWFRVYAQIADKADMNAVSHKIKDVKKNSIGKEADKNNSQVLLHPMRRWHLYDEFKNGVNTGGRITYVWLFGIISVFTLLLACINFMNLSTARSEKRAKEVGIRKAVGSVRWQLVGQFFTESVLTAFLSFIVSLGLLYVALPLFERIAGKQMDIPFFNAGFWIGSFGVAILTGIFAGAYPALYLSSFRPVKVLKGTFKTGKLAAIPRKVLLVVQFTVSIVMIVGTVVIFRQVQFARNRPVGYEMDRIVSINTGAISKHFETFRSDLLASGKFIEAAASETGVSNTFITNSGFNWKGKDPAMQEEFTTLGVTTSFGRTVNWKLLDGRDFSADFASDSSGIIINETAARYLGFEKPVGEILQWGMNEQVHIIGVVQDMITQSPYQPVKQSFFYLRKGYLSTINARVSPSAPMPEALAVLKRLCEKYNPADPFEYGFLDEEYAKNFATEVRVGKLATWFAVLAIFISCLGLFGMASFVAEQRTKEIGVRKVLGASVLNLWKLLSIDFVVLVFISLVIATPVAWYFMNGWLQNYQYRAPLSWWIFATAGAGALLITLVTISFQTIRAALANPAKSLRTE